MSYKGLSSETQQEDLNKSSPNLSSGGSLSTSFKPQPKPDQISYPRPQTILFPNFADLQLDDWGGDEDLQTPSKTNLVLALPKSKPSKGKGKLIKGKKMKAKGQAQGNNEKAEEILRVINQVTTESKGDNDNLELSDSEKAYQRDIGPAIEAILGGRPSPTKVHAELGAGGGLNDEPEPGQLFKSLEEPSSSEVTEPSTSQMTSSSTPITTREGRPKKKESKVKKQKKAQQNKITPAAASAPKKVKQAPFSLRLSKSVIPHPHHRVSEGASPYLTLPNPKVKGNTKALYYPKHPPRTSTGIDLKDKHPLAPTTSVSLEALNLSPRIEESSILEEPPEPSSAASSSAPEDQIRNRASGIRAALPNPLPKTPNMLEVNLYLYRVQNYIDQLGYQKLGEPLIRVNTRASVRNQMDTAKMLIRAGEPIKCLHAFVLGIHFTNVTGIVERFPINFKSVLNGREFKHIVLGVYLYGQYGALGISRDPGLQDKPFKFNRLSDLLMNYNEHYQASGHVLKEIKIGGIITRDPHSLETITWKIVPIIKISDLTTGQAVAQIERAAKLLRGQMGQVCLRQLRTPEITLPFNLLLDESALSPTTRTPYPNIESVKAKMTAPMCRIEDRKIILPKLNVPKSIASNSTSKKVTKKKSSKKK